MVSRRKMNSRKSTKSRRIMKSRRRSTRTMAKRSRRTIRRRSTRKLGGKPGGKSKFGKTFTMFKAIGSNQKPTRSSRKGASGDAIVAIKRKAAAEKAAAEQAAADRVDKIDEYNKNIKDLRDSITLNEKNYFEVKAELDDNASYFPDSDEEYKQDREDMHQELHKLNEENKLLNNKLDKLEKERDILQQEQDKYLGSIDASVF